MTRRDLLWSAMLARADSPMPTAAAVVLDAKSGHVRWIQDSTLAERWRVPAGSTVKPFTLVALLQQGLLRPSEEVLCRRHVRIAGLNLDCSHPVITRPFNVSDVISYSCNSGTSQWASRLEPGTFTRLLSGFGWHVDSMIDPQLQALGERGVMATALEMAKAYRQLAMLVQAQKFVPVLKGLEGAVAFGTAQKAQVTGLRIAGKTGTVRAASGIYVACFAGWAPSRSPEVVVAVAVQGLSGGAAAAPLAAQLFHRYQQGQL